MVICPPGCNSSVYGSPQKWLKEEGTLIYIYIYISQTLSRWSEATLVNEKWHTCLSLFNEHKVPSVWCVCFMHVCAGTRQRDGRENGVKLFVIISVLHFVVPTHVSIATHTVQTGACTCICTHTACHVLSRCSSSLFYCSIPVPISLLSGRDPSLPQAAIWIKPS